MNKINEILNTEHGFPEDWGFHITCPYCDGHYTHFESVKKRETDDSDAWDGRGGAARIAMYCEQCPNLFYIRVGEHKGQSFLGVEETYEVAKMHNTDV